MSYPIPFHALVLLTGVFAATGAEPFRMDRCELVPLPDSQLSFQDHGIEKLRWHFSRDYSRPFFFPLVGPSGATLTRIGHPGAENHDHHRSVWFAHHKVNGLDFWSENGGTQIRQKHWYAYRDGDEEAVMASKLAWFGPAGVEVMESDLVAALRPLPSGEHLVELQLTLRPADKAESVELGQSNFGIIAVRVAKTMTGHFGGGQIADSAARVGEANIFGKSASWVDYSGPVAVGTGPARKSVIEGVTLFDHPGNPAYPAKWHVREDGWMGPSLCRDNAIKIAKATPLTLRYLLHAHSGPVDPVTAARLAGDFKRRPGFVIEKSKKPHRQYDVRRLQP